MCRRVECKRCGRPTFAGCGAHVEQVLGDVPQPERCRCREEPAPNPFCGVRLVPGMDSWLGLVAFLVVWIALQTWVLRRLGVPT